MRFTEELANSPDDSDVKVLQKVFTKLMSLQKQLDHSYHGNRFLRVQLMASGDM